MEQVLSCPSFQWGRCHVVSPFLACLPVGRGVTIMPRQQPSGSRRGDSGRRPRGIIRESALYRRKKFEANGFAQKECLVLSTAERGPSGRPLYVVDPHLPVVQRQLVRLFDRATAPRSKTSGQPRGMDALELPPDLGADRRMMNLAWPKRIHRGHGWATS